MQPINKKSKSIHFEHDSMRKILLIATTLCVASSCSLYKTFKTPETPVENLCGEGVAVQDSVTALLPWQEMFPDKPLQELIGKGLAANSDLRIARLNIEQSEAMLRSSKLAYLPSFALTPEGSITKPENTPASYAYQLPLTMQWELDVFGKLRNSKEKARASLLQSREYVKMVQTQLVAGIANTYYTLVMMDEQLRITRATIQNQKENLEVMIALKEAGMQTETAVNQASAQYYSIQSSGKDLEKQIRTVENSLALLINEPPHAIRRSLFSESEAIRMDHNQPVPLTALANRPDVKEAEYALRGQFYGVNVARSAFYPSISLGGSIGWTNNLGVIANPGSLLISAIGSLAQPLFNRGVNRANLKIAKAQYEQALIGFEKSLLVAGNEVNDALIACQNSAAKTTLRQKQVQANEQALSNSLELMKHSSMTYLEILIAQSSLLQAQLLQASDWLEGKQGQINLYKALGGGAQ